MTGKELASYALAMLGTPYFYGAKMEVMTLEKMLDIHNRYPSRVTQAYINKAITKGLVGKKCTDCSGLIGAFRKKQISSAALYETASRCIPISNLASFPVGAVLWKSGHVGVYIGGGHCVEAKGLDYGTIKSKVSDTKWLYGLLFSDMQYTETGGKSVAEIKGIDVSSYNTNGIDKNKNKIPIDWRRVKQSGYEFAILKVIRKDLVIDNQFENNWSGCTTSGVTIQGVYNYSYATSVNKAITDANAVITALAGRKVMIWLDIEDKILRPLGSTLTNIINAYQSVIERAGLPFGVYTGLSFYKSYIRPYASVVGCPFWIARYGVNNGKKIDSNKPDIKHTLQGWQYTSKGTVDGIVGNVDLNVFYSGLESTQITTTTYPTLGVGSTGSYVVAWQNYLNIKGFNCGKADGIFGNKTYLAVKAYQNSRKLLATGVITDKEWASVN